MKLQNALWVLASLAIHSTAWAYGMDSGGGAKACAKPKFSEFKPEDNARVAAKSPFSFLASAETWPKSLKVTIKDQPVPITITPKNNGFLVTGKLPDTLKGGYARINITAEGADKCTGNDGWLIKIAE